MQSLYVIQCKEFYKIGIANDVVSRLAQLSTGNPFPLELLAVYGYENAEPVERAIHQLHKSRRGQGEWFALSGDDLEKTYTICRMLGGTDLSDKVLLPTEGEIISANDVLESITNTDWDYSAMFGDGWRMDKQDSRGIYWNWRRGSANNRKTIYGGAINKLPHSLENMRRVFRDGLPPLGVDE